MRRQLSTIGIAALVLSLSGCPFKKKQPPVPQQAQAPTTPAPQPAPPPEAKPEETQPPPPPPEAPPEKTETTAEKPKPKKKPSAKKPATPATGQQAAAATPAPTQTSKLIIQEGPTPNSQGQQAASAGLDELSPHSKQTTEQLLQSAQTNLNSINRPLSPEEQAMVAQIKDYMAQSRKATADSDSVRAHNLALKARLLSDELVKR
jgi:outer membrane biosynthesis protein TonB